VRGLPVARGGGLPCAALDAPNFHHAQTPPVYGGVRDASNLR
jgi:hypothetical protein